ncbi:GGDEF domain-containing protein [Vibrio gallicus]|uniref:GGDEF domain-containing protein n=1 Tax=Vibrio gallicus TaxID=190897 RepID=UPI0021C3051F|nr:GGDEF domain-containing protein [Vibrio gallicus]
MKITSATETSLFTLAVVACAALGIYFIEFYHLQRQQQLQTLVSHQAQQKAAEVASLLTLEIQKKGYSAYTLANVIANESQITNEQLTFLSQNLQQHDPHIMGLLIAPSNNISFIYPADIAKLPLLSTVLDDNQTLLRNIADLQSHPNMLATGAIYQHSHHPSLYVVTSAIYEGPSSLRNYMGYVMLLVDMDALLTDSQFIDEQYLITAVNLNRPSQYLGIQGAIHNSIATANIVTDNVNWRVYVATNPDYTLPKWPLFNSVRLIGYTLLSALLVGLSLIIYLYLQARQRSMQDELTTLPNRRYLVYTLKNLVRNAGLTHTQFAVINLDLDGFKAINDQHGHSSGDLLLKQVANVLRKAVRANDVVARVGGDEFLIIASRIKHESEVISLIDNIQHKVESDRYHVKGAMVKIQISIGYSLFKDTHTTFDNLLSTADINMYKNKALKKKLRQLRYKEHQAIATLERKPHDSDSGS